MAKVNERQRRFVDEYMVDGNIMQSAIRAGYSEKYAQGSSYLLMEHSGIKELLAIKEKERVEYLQQRFSFDAQVARDVMFQLLKDNDTPEAVRLAAAKDFLDRAGFKPVDKQETTLSGGLNVEERSKVFEKYLNGGDEG